MISACESKFQTEMFKEFNTHKADLHIEIYMNLKGMRKVEF